MPLDAITLRALTEELRPQLLNLRIDKVQQPARDQVILLLRGNKRLLLNAGTNAPRLQLTELLRDNPAEPPMFCMLLRKHLVGARVADITQPGLERLVRIELDVTDDFGQPGHRTLVLEAMKRLDLAINDKTGILNIPHLTEKCRNEECISVFRSFKSYRSGELVRRGEKECMGNTLYIGSLQSEVYFCIYEKDYEQYKKHDIPIADAEVKNRFEIRLKNERAFYAIRDLLEHDNPEQTAFQIINRYVRFVDRDDTKPRSDWRISEEWAWFMGEHRGSLKLTTKPEPYSFERTLHWLSHQVAPTLKLALRLDKMNHTQIVHDIITHARLTEKHEKILKQQAAAAKEVVL